MELSNYQAKITTAITTLKSQIAILEFGVAEVPQDRDKLATLAKNMVLAAAVVDELISSPAFPLQGPNVGESKAPVHHKASQIKEP